MCYIAVSTRWNELSSVVETVIKSGIKAEAFTKPVSPTLPVAFPSTNVSSQQPSISPIHLSSTTASSPTSSYHGILPAHLYHSSNTTTLDHQTQQPLSHSLSRTQPADTTSQPTHFTRHISVLQQSEKRHSGNLSKRRWSSESAESQKAVSSSQTKVHRRTISPMEAGGE